MFGQGENNELTHWQKVKLNGEGSPDIYLEILESGDRREVGIFDAIPFDQITKILVEITQHLGDSLERTKPKKACVELGLAFGLQNGGLVALIARGSSSANLKITLEWDRT
jgi:hypothetical protein